MTHTRIRDDVQQAGDPSVAALCVRDQDSALAASCDEPLAAGRVGRTPRRGGSIAREARSEPSGAGNRREPGAAPAPT